MQIHAQKINLSAGSISFAVENSTIEMTTDEFMKVIYHNAPPTVPHKSVHTTPIDQGLIDEGYVAFCNLCDMWIKNFGVNAEQPDRSNLLLQMATQYNLQVISYVKASGGLTQAVYNCLAGKINNKHESEVRQFCRIIAENMSQVSSILYPPLSDQLELQWEGAESE